MIIFTYVTAALISIGILCALMPRKIYAKCQFDFRILGAWLIMLSSSTQCMVWIIYILYFWLKAILSVYGNIGGFAA